MREDTLSTGDDVRRPEVDVLLRPPAYPSYAALVVLRGEHDLVTAEGIRAALAPLLGNVLVDLGDCDFVDSTVIGVLIRQARALEREGHRLELVVPPDRTAIARTLEIVQIGRHMTVHPRAPEIRGEAAS